ncbi:DUF1285 domain-containing protein [Oharaeibacter diazotrophicus]|uniref:DUF1285 domain-containing protein n=1 Tax=Oharaeibacter diazotrophicus TaxID=1920512 RepID=A0A4R6RBX9_9HYPH|nr:DUF1285 domain-containing protein [Oharaeibacter diazotrophicus]TDP83554.1 hypothetical protein EDD54_3516 [Oharaeibacter diazotrophicus]BBE72387.1 hypothetical protein OHA_1_01977 [Pleomorphomonas sp. SM30]GLS79158.1 hypothetical protein GCM10007904_44950 [Oharaeibacter diazotrophicus]
MDEADDRAGRGDVGGLAALVARAAPDGRRPPVERWNPPFCGDIDMAIDREGRWHYMGSPIGREALVRLFAGVLRLEDGRYVLVTPVEKVGIRVADVPFLAVEMHAEGDGAARRITFRTNVGDLVEAGPDHAIRFALDERGGLVPYVHVRAGLEARLTRPLLHEIADLVETRGDDLGVFAGGVFHRLPAEASA